jgi:hypothetical protein
MPSNPTYVPDVNNDPIALLPGPGGLSPRHNRKWVDLPTGLTELPIVLPEVEMQFPLWVLSNQVDVEV